MANTDSPFGLKPVKLDFTRCTMYPIELDYDTSLFLNDPVVLTSGGYLNKCTAADSNYVLGAVVAVFKSELASDGNQLYLTPVGYYPSTAAATEQYYALVADDPDQIFEIQEDGDTSDLAVTSNGAGVNFIFTHSGSTTTNVSGVEADSSSLGTSNKQLKLLGKVNRLDPASGAYNTYGDFCKWQVRIALHQNTALV